MKGNCCHDEKNIFLPFYGFREHPKEAQGKTAKIIQTVGVPHNVTEEIIKEAYEKDRGAFSDIANQPKVAMVILGGDAPTPNGGLRFYTAEDALKAAKHIGNLCQEESRFLMVFNGPRTGQHDQADPYLTRNWAGVIPTNVWIL